MVLHIFDDCQKLAAKLLHEYNFVSKMNVLLLGGVSNDMFCESIEKFNQSNLTNMHIGLKNLSQNVCFSNSVIQLLYSIPKLRAEIFNRNDLP